MSGIANHNVWKTINWVMTTKPTKFEPIFGIVLSAYQNDPGCIKIIGDIHQNSYGDPMHISISIVGAHGAEVNMHIYGYFKNCFIVHHLDMETGIKTYTTVATWGFF